jgi:23S rRNA pseudouridine2605 synthase
VRKALVLRLQKLLASAGIGSRRTVERWIREGRVTVGGRVAQLGDRAMPGDDVRLDGARVPLASEAAGPHEVLLYHKPVGEVTTRSDPQGRPTVFDRLPGPRHGRWIVVGRLDVSTSGLLLFTTDGELAHRLMHPSAEVEREYRVRVRGRPGAAVIRALSQGVELEDGWARFERIVPEPEGARHGSSTPAGRAHGHEHGDVAGSHSWYRVVLKEGRNREVRRMWSAVGCEVSRLVRIRYGSLGLPESLAPGSWRRADSRQCAELGGAALSAPSNARKTSSKRRESARKAPSSRKQS